MSVSSLYPTQYSGTVAVARVRALTNYASQPVDATIYTYLQDALEQLQADLQEQWLLEAELRKEITHYKDLLAPYLEDDDE